jgi:hypothetical protein
MTEKAKQEKDVPISKEDRRKMIEDQLKTAVQKRDEYTTLIFKCQGALELLDSMEEEK